LKNGKSIDEVDGANCLFNFRQEEKDFKGLSFDTISGSGPNGAIIHYKPEKPSAAKITMDQMYLCDSGGQYLDGTTDVTRTLHFGNPSKEEMECFTRVLLGHIALDQAVFPTGTTGFMLDCLARLPLWQAGLDYRHGTGHGVGHFLNVHEGPQSISFHVKSNETSLIPGMTVTNEPGFYSDGRFGIRIENVLIVEEANTPNNFGNVKFNRFENLTMVPIQTKLMDVGLMMERDIGWVNEHHQKCWERVSPLLEKDPLALEYLRRETRPISKK
jgi:Xaa-Pro aminopeptidase